MHLRTRIPVSYADQWGLQDATLPAHLRCAGRQLHCAALLRDAPLVNGPLRPCLDPRSPIGKDGNHLLQDAEQQGQIICLESQIASACRTAHRERALSLSSQSGDPDVNILCLPGQLQLASIRRDGFVEPPAVLLEGLDDLIHSGSGQYTVNAAGTTPFSKRMSEELLTYLLEKNFSAHPRDKLTRQQIQYLNLQRKQLGDKVFKKIAIQAKQNRQQLQSLSPDDLDLYIIKQDAKFLDQLRMLNIAYSQSSDAGCSSPGGAAKNQPFEQELLLRKSDSLQQQLASSQITIEQERENQQKLHKIIQQQNYIISQHMQMFQKLVNHFAPSIDIEPFEKQLAGQWQLVDFLLAGQSSITKNQLLNIKNDCTAIRSGLQGLRKQLQHASQQFGADTSSTSALNAAVEGLLRALSTGVQYRSKVVFVGAKHHKTNSYRLRQVEHQLETFDLKDFAAQNFTPNVELFKYLVESYVGLHKSPQMLRYFNTLDSAFVDKLSKNRLVDSKADCVFLRIQASEVEKFMQFLSSRAESGDCIQFSNNCAMVYYRGGDIYELCKTYQLLGEGNCVFVGNAEDMDVVEAAG